MIKAILFDVDGIFVHREKYFSEYLQEKFNIPLHKTLPFFTGVFQKCLVGEADLKEEVQKYFKDWGWNKSFEELIQIWFEQEKKMDEQVLGYVKGLKKKGIKIFLGTNNEKYRTDYLRETLGLGKIFDNVYGSGYVGHMKPHAGFFQHILHEQKLLPHEVLFWDDDVINVEGAKQVGMHAEFFSSLEHMKKKIEDYLKCGNAQSAENEGEK